MQSISDENNSSHILRAYHMSISIPSSLPVLTHFCFRTTFGEGTIFTPTLQMQKPEQLNDFSKVTELISGRVMAQS